MAFAGSKTNAEFRDMTQTPTYLFKALDAEFNFCLDPFPTGVGMNRLDQLLYRIRQPVPHRRGDEPRSFVITLDFQSRSPQAWG